MSPAKSLPRKAQSGPGDWHGIKRVMLRVTEPQNGNIIAFPLPPELYLYLYDEFVMGTLFHFTYRQFSLFFNFSPLIKPPFWVPEWITTCLSQAWHDRDANSKPKSVLLIYFCSWGRPRSNWGMHFPALFGCGIHMWWCSCQFNFQLKLQMQLLPHLLKTESQPWSFYFFHLPTGRKGEVRSDFGNHLPGFLSHCMVIPEPAACHPEMLNWEFVLEKEENVAIYWAEELLDFGGYFTLEFFLP